MCQSSRITFFHYIWILFEKPSNTYLSCLNTCYFFEIRFFYFYKKKQSAFMHIIIKSIIKIISPRTVRVWNITTLRYFDELLKYNFIHEYTRFKLRSLNLICIWMYCSYLTSTIIFLTVICFVFKFSQIIYCLLYNQIIFWISTLHYCCRASIGSPLPNTCRLTRSVGEALKFKYF